MTSLVLAMTLSLLLAPGLRALPFQEPIPEPEVRLRGPARKFADLSPVACKRELKRLGLPVRFTGPMSGVATPVRIVGPIGGVLLQTGPASSPFGVADCRLVLLWNHIGPVLRAHHVKRIVIDNFYRRGARIHRKKRSQHSYALATDITRLFLDDGTELEIERDFQGTMGAPVCGPTASSQGLGPKAVLLRNLVCELGRLGAFQHILTPNYDRAHRNHLHLDIERGGRWFSIN